ncbi:MAG: hypothetical protein A3H96_08610 [Acidobacteria bacterium RIFCSPLOWO2_02_FULL_67_36]|nr:MAG: hypothetical protein A3H96_08610 [Acidobacteria bacterium RIFCSPLOWO2_02_FULL_67_36]OFW22313.1 MAG: hypothetical protein A3G21_01885 [Acidobacteria bacterium RIFCSPLOWO2_12_FULL_66_21]
MPAGRPRKNKKNVLVKSAELLGWALGGLEKEIAQTRERLANLTAQAHTLRARVGGGTKGASAAAQAAEPAPGRRRRRRRMSAEARKRISEMMKKRWAERKRNK